MKKPLGLDPEAPETEEARRGHRWALLLLVGIGLLGGGTWIFIELADEVNEKETHLFDRQILLSMRVEGDLSDPLGPDWLEEMVRDFTALGGVGVLTLLTLAVVLYLVLMKNYRSAALVAVAIGTGIVGSTLLKAGFDRPRPDLVPHGTHISSSSFPSGHSMMSALVYFTLGLILAAVQKLGRRKVFIVVMAVFANNAGGCQPGLPWGALAHRCFCRLAGGCGVGNQRLDVGAMGPLLLKSLLGTVFLPGRWFDPESGQNCLRQLKSRHV